MSDVTLANMPWWARCALFGLVNVIANRPVVMRCATRDRLASDANSLRQMTASGRWRMTADVPKDAQAYRTLLKPYPRRMGRCIVLE